MWHNMLSDRRLPGPLVLVNYMKLCYGVTTTNLTTRLRCNEKIIKNLLLITRKKSS